MYRLRRFVLETDCSALWELMSTGGDVPAFPNQPAITDEDDLRAWIEGQLMGPIHDLYVVTWQQEPSAEEMVGVVMSYDYRVYDSHCHIYGCVWRGVLREALALFTELLFREYPLRKLYLRATDVDTHLIEAAEAIGFEREVVLREAAFTQGAYHDVYIDSMYSNVMRA